MISLPSSQWKRFLALAAPLGVFFVTYFLLAPRVLPLHPVTPAYAEGFDESDPTCKERVVIYGMQGPDTTIAKGAIAESDVLDHSFASCFSGNTSVAAMGNTARLHLGGTSNSWIEVGWMIKNTSSACTNITPTNHCVSIFTEWGLNGGSQNQTLWNPSSPNGKYLPLACVNTGKWDLFDVETTDITGSSWSLFVDCEDGVGARLIKQYANIGYATGIPEAEVFERSTFDSNGNVVNSTDLTGNVHRNLGYYNYHLQGLSSTGLTCRHDNDLNWDASLPSGTEMDIVPGSATCGSDTN